MKSPKLVLIGAIIILPTLLLSGCAALARGAAEEPYRKAMLEGRMTPTEYSQKRDEIRQASQAN